MPPGSGEPKPAAGKPGKCPAELLAKLFAELLAELLGDLLAELLFDQELFLELLGEFFLEPPAGEPVGLPPAARLLRAKCSEVSVPTRAV